MSLDKCKQCKNVGFCAIPENRVITKCEQYEAMDTAAAYDWDLQEMLKLWDLPEKRIE